ncbi:MAG: PIN domain nuclease [Chloroflexi bacterium]|nr:MAG: hypothetical protein B6I35_09155 [Anaerolineaceae bacterium 4572_32.2]RLC77022.1 MAG: PIN domain nuclease [Chloroflexota bacterium]RLC85641.1 MAG: PIN domain nuclease [Chloroflexota bacterium]
MVTDNFFSGAIVPDTSVILKWFLHEGEIGREQALAMRHAYLEGRVQLLVLDLLLYEVANVLRYKPDWDASRVARAIHILLALKLQVIPVSPALLQRAVELAYKHDLAVYDASFVALAEEKRAVFITADQKAARRLEALPHVRSLTDITAKNC